MNFKNILSIALLIIIVPLIPTFTTWVGSIYQHYFDHRSVVGVVPIKGVLYDSTSTVKQLTTFFKDPSVKAVLLKIDCMGSTSGTGQTIYNELKSLKVEYQKPVIALVENICASGGYYIACAADYIITSPSAMVGSIGVRFPSISQFILKDVIEKHGIKYHPLAAGDYKNAGDFFIDRSPEHRAMLQSLLDDTYQQFVEDVSQSRKVSPAKASEWANGKIFTGRQALALGLVDQLGSITQATKAIKEKALIEGDIKWIHPKTPGGLLRFLTGGDSNEHEMSFCASVVNECCQALETRYAATPELAA